MLSERRTLKNQERCQGEERRNGSDAGTPGTESEHGSGRPGKCCEGKAMNKRREIPRKRAGKKVSNMKRSVQYNPIRHDLIPSLKDLLPQHNTGSDGQGDSFLFFSLYTYDHGNPGRV